MLSETCQALKNWFDDDGKGGKNRIFGTFTVKNGTFEVPGAQEGQYIRICDSVFNDGVYKYPLSGLTDETFDGAVWLMKVPPDVIAADQAYDAWKKENADVLNSPYQSESFGGYSYTKASGSGTEGMETVGTGILTSPYADQIKRWRKL